MRHIINGFLLSVLIASWIIMFMSSYQFRQRNIILEQQLEKYKFVGVSVQYETNKIEIASPIFRITNYQNIVTSATIYINIKQ